MFHLPNLRTIFCLTAVLLALPAAHAAERTGLDLAKAKNCLACHQVEAKRVGPSYQAVAERFATDAGAEQKLQTAIRKGSVRQWGAVPMPAQPGVSEAEALQLAQWILSLKK